MAVLPPPRLAPTQSLQQTGLVFPQNTVPQEPTIQSRLLEAISSVFNPPGAEFLPGVAGFKAPNPLMGLRAASQQAKAPRPAPFAGTPPTSTTMGRQGLENALDTTGTDLGTALNDLSFNDFARSQRDMIRRLQALEGPTSVRTAPPGRVFTESGRHRPFQSDLSTEQLKQTLLNLRQSNPRAFDRQVGLAPQNFSDVSRPSDPFISIDQLIRSHPRDVAGLLRRKEPVPLTLGELSQQNARTFNPGDFLEGPGSTAAGFQALADRLNKNLRRFNRPF